jgi:hypothetical protein
MTAVVAILNKQAVALSADSAFTIDNGSGNNKIFNKANKVFALSKHHPVGVMIYNSATFMSTPWETIIKVYRKQLGNQSFSTLKAYQENFISSLREKNFYTTIDEQKFFLKQFGHTVIDTIINQVAQANRPLIENVTDENKLAILSLIEQSTDNYIQQYNVTDNLCEDFADYTYEAFVTHSAAIFDELITHNFNNNGYHPSSQLRDKLSRIIYHYLRTKEQLTSFTGIIFTGFGEDEIYPSLIPVNISLGIEGRLRYYIDEGRTAKITNSNPGAVCPFAQTDVIDTILTGIDPTLESTFNSNFTAIIKKYNEEVLTLIGDTNPTASAVLRELNISALADEYSKQNLLTKEQNYIYPLMTAVSTLSKEDLAEMAESLIYLTYLKRRITFAEESVGTPVDVALISKGDGLIWIKRKHYFKPELNRHFFDNYFNH